MECEDRKQRSVAFLLKSLNETERNYKIHDKEMLAVVRRLENQKHLLEDAKYKFEVWTNHKNLKYFIKTQKLNQRQAHWTLYLSRFDFTLKHVPETKMGKVDGLSRKLDQKVGIEKDNCYDLKSLEWDKRITLVLSNTRELDRVPSTKQSILYTTTYGLCSLLCTLP